MGNKRSSDGGGTVGGFIVGVIVLVALVPKPVWIALGVCVAAALLIWLVSALVAADRKRRAEAEERERAERIERAAAAKREREDRARREKQARIDALGKDNAALVEKALHSVTVVTGSEAARKGWLGDVDFSADIAGINDAFGKAHALRGVTDRLSALDKPSADDRRILAEARTTIAGLERTACERVELIAKCAREAQLVDRCLRAERTDARVAEERAQLHGQLSAMLYGVEATPTPDPADSTAEVVRTRVRAYLEIKNQIDRTRGVDR
ncbi:hypothetical protein [Mycolicibacterium grossiae]|uniref:Uncharacterized protein n=1 Tax=Mycolicibacterium grossiae TaxID=1552759 RepID=A0A1E8PXZ0_9MYCO|nr:hypothetical protein [Mycolicibacterium grossiae]OFJ50720.1 hypothetical protein BEL07_26650 [Mycolicibacterium grossiae]QEM44453.1 hypothetical protein FZ046_06320 [Mycolicibacterium grossiae]